MRPLLATQQTTQYKRHRPENTFLYQLMEQHYPEFKEALSEQGKQLPTFVEREFDDFLRCGRLEHGFLRVVCGDCKHEKLVAFICQRRGFCPSCKSMKEPNDMTDDLRWVAIIRVHFSIFHTRIIS